ncbi:uncharacterized protein LOC106666369 [Cimex lectularius]|uniref:Uncharacterized protein n=1 Tax=Cimex lectularius TaxID=79782 RepID=A0A8I6TM13_CIMLE|nr:uncharacterized protein LOC106666369 [Cimex lectularius]
MSCLKVCSWLPRVKTCCFCHTLPIGTQIIGWVSVVLSLLGLTAQGVAVHELNDRSLFGTAMIGAVLVLISGILLLVGIYTKNNVLVQIWLVIAFCTIIWMIIELCFILIYFLEGHLHFNTFLSLLIRAILWLLIMSYFLVVVYSYYDQQFGL